MYQHPFGLACWPPLPPAVGIPADQFLLLGVDADDRLAGGQLLLGLLVDIAELGVPVGVLGALLGLEGALQRVALLGEQPADGVVGDLEALRGKRVGQLAGRLAGPPQRRLRVPTSVRVDQLVQRAEQARVPLDQPLGSAAGTPDAPTRVRRVVQFSHPGVHGRAGQPTDPGHARAATTTERAGGRTGQQAALLLGQVRGNQLVQSAQHGVHVHAATLPPRPAPIATIGQTSHAGTP
jgi:hypothetical protein